MMRGVTTTLAEAQQHVLQFVQPDTFLLGHALENDLKALKLVHLRNVDTAMLYPHARVRLPSCFVIETYAGLRSAAHLGQGSDVAVCKQVACAFFEPLDAVLRHAWVVLRFLFRVRPSAADFGGPN